jgi:hypothetical protein
MIRGYERHRIRGTMQRLRRTFRRVWVLLADLSRCEASDCGFDELTQSGINPNCLSCKGTGRVITYRPHEVKARIKVFDFVELQGAGAAPPGVELGDVALYVRLHDKKTFSTCNLDTYSYVVLEGDPVAYRPFSITADGVGLEDETRIILKKTKDVQRAAGY